MSVLDLNPDQLLTTTRAVRKRLDFSRPVPDDVVRECVSVALQSPSGSNNPTMHYVVVRDSARRRAIGDIYRFCFTQYQSMDGTYLRTIDKGSEDANRVQQRSADSADYLADHMGDAPVLVLACTQGRMDNVPGIVAASLAGNIVPAMWSFMLAARARGLGTCWTTLHLMMEEQTAEVVGIPFDTVQQVCLSPLAYTKGTEFKAAARPEPESVIHWDHW